MTRKNKLLQSIQSGWSPFVTIAIITFSVIGISIYCLLSGWVIIFQNLFYFPIILACAYYAKKGFVFSVALSFVYLFLMIVFTKDAAVVIQALIRVFIFVSVAGVTTFLSIKRKLAEGTLHENEEKYRNLFESSRDAIMTLEPPAWMFTSGNPATIKMFGAKNEEEFISCGPWELSPERQPDGRASLEKAKEMIETAVREGSHFFEWTHRRISGEYFSADVLLARVEQKGKVMLQATVRDITERKQMEDELGRHREILEKMIKERTAELEQAMNILRENELKYRALFETANDAILLFTEGVWVDCNAGAMRVFGCTREQIIGAHPNRFSPPTQPDGRSSEEDAIKKINLAFTVGPQVFEWEHCRADGTTFAAEVCLNRLDFEGKSYIQAIVRDVSERKQVAEALVRETANLNAIFESSPIGMMILDETTNIVMANASLVILAGGSMSDVAQHRPGNALRCIHSVKDPRGCGYAAECHLCVVRNALETLIASGGTMQGAEVALELIRNGEPGKVWLKLGAETVLINGRRHLCVAIEDITVRKQAAEKLLAQLEELRRWYAVTISREKRMEELKSEVNQLLVRLGSAPKYLASSDPQVKAGK